MHPDIIKFVHRFEEEAAQAGRYRSNIGKFELIFLESVLGPVLQYNLQSVKAEYPLKDFRGGDRFIDFVYFKGGLKLLMEIDGFTTHARDISPGDFTDHLTRQNDLILQGWMILRFSTYQIEKRPMICQRQITQAIGHWWTLAHNYSSANEKDIWHTRKYQVIQLAINHGGFIRNVDISRHFGIAISTSKYWIARFISDQILIPIRSKQRITGYRLNGYGAD